MDEIESRLSAALEEAKPAKLDPLMSSADMTWQTPDNFLNVLRSMGPIVLDPCTTKENPTGAQIIMTPELDGLAHMWALAAGGGLVFMNPPYGRGVGEWTRKATEEARHGAEIVALVAARTETEWWHNAIKEAAAVAFWRGRLTFRGAANAAPFPSAVIYWGSRVALFQATFEPWAWVVETCEASERLEP